MLFEKLNTEMVYTKFCTIPPCNMSTHLYTIKWRDICFIKLLYLFNGQNTNFSFLKETFSADWTYKPTEADLPQIWRDSISKEILCSTALRR